MNEVEKKNTTIASTKDDLKYNDIEGDKNYNENNEGNEGNDANDANDRNENYTYDMNVDIEVEDDSLRKRSIGTAIDNRDNNFINSPNPQNKIIDKISEELLKNKKETLRSDQSSEHDSIVYIKELKSKNRIDKLRSRELHMDTFDSCTSSEFRAGMGYEQSFLSKENSDINNLKIDIKNINE